jgi:hypothetical protein
VAAEPPEELLRAVRGHDEPGREPKKQQSEVHDLNRPSSELLY